jgi:hypothetical protein
MESGKNNGLAGNWDSVGIVMVSLVLLAIVLYITVNK